jgi:tetratricopeptide (TPR) repeat protein
MRSEFLMLQGRAREAIPTAMTAADEARGVGELEGLARAYMALDGSYQLLGEPEKAVNERKALEIYTRLGNVRSQGITEMNLGVQAYADGRWTEAGDLYRRAQEDCLRAGDRQSAMVAAANLGELLVSQGKLDEAERVLVDARRALRSAGHAAFVVFAEIQLARCSLDRGDARFACESLERVAAEAAEVGYAAFLLEAGVYLAHAHAQTGSPEAGLEALDAAIRVAGEEAKLYIAPIERARAACLSALGRSQEASDHLGLALVEAVAQGLLYEQLLARRARTTLSAREAQNSEELREIDRLAQLLGVDS